MTEGKLPNSILVRSSNKWDSKRKWKWCTVMDEWLLNTSVKWLHALSLSYDFNWTTFKFKFGFVTTACDLNLKGRTFGITVVRHLVFMTFLPASCSRSWSSVLVNLKMIVHLCRLCSEFYCATKSTFFELARMLILNNSFAYAISLIWQMRVAVLNCMYLQKVYVPRSGHCNDQNFNSFATP